MQGHKNQYLETLGGDYWEILNTCRSPGPPHKLGATTLTGLLLAGTCPRTLFRVVYHSSCSQENEEFLCSFHLFWFCRRKRIKLQGQLRRIFTFNCSYVWECLNMNSSGLFGHVLTSVFAHACVLYFSVEDMCVWLYICVYLYTHKPAR